jgi:hypothetical protein
MAAATATAAKITDTTIATFFCVNVKLETQSPIRELVGDAVATTSLRLFSMSIFVPKV